MADQSGDPLKITQGRLINGYIITGTEAVYNRQLVLKRVMRPAMVNGRSNLVQNSLMAALMSLKPIQLPISTRKS
jgi:hypothetical protein